MLLGIKSAEAIFFRHLGVAFIGLLLAGFVWQANDTWSPDMRLWKSLGGASFSLLWFAVFIGPAARIWQPLQRLISFRREVGVWFFLIAFLHGYLILDESGFGLANLAGLMALTFAFTLATTSFDRAVNFLGVSSWKWLHSFSYVVFYLSVIHVLYFAFIHYTPSLLRAVLSQPTNYPDNPLKFYYLAAFLSVLLLQVIAFIVTVRKQRKSGW